MMNRPKMIQRNVEQTINNFAGLLQALHIELEIQGRNKIASLLYKKATLTGEYLIKEPSIENLADFIHESKVLYHEEDSSLGILLCAYGVILEGAKQLLRDLEFLNRINSSMIGRTKHEKKPSSLCHSCRVGGEVVGSRVE